MTRQAFHTGVRMSIRVSLQTHTQNLGAVQLSVLGRARLQPTLGVQIWVCNTTWPWSDGKRFSICRQTTATSNVIWLCWSVCLSRNTPRNTSKLATFCRCSLPSVLYFPMRAHSKTGADLPLRA